MTRPHTPGQVSLTLPQVIEQAFIAWSGGDAERAERLARIVLGADPGQVDALNLLGAIASRRGQSAEAVDLLGRVAALKPHSPDAQTNHGIALHAIGRIEEALACHDRAIAVRTDHAEAHYNRAGALKALGRIEEALAAFERTLSIRPDHVAALNNRALVLQLLGDCEGAVASCDRALELRPDHAEAWINRGNALKALGRLDEAVHSYDRAIALRPGFAIVHDNRGLALHGLGRLEAALESFDRAVALDASLPQGWGNRGDVLQALHRFEAALASYDHALARSGGNADLHHNRGLALHELKRFEEAVASQDRAIALAPDHAAAWSSRGMALRKLGRFDEAVPSLDRATALDPRLDFALGMALHVRMLACDWAGFEALRARVDEGVRAQARCAEPFGYQGVCDDEGLLQIAARTYSGARHPRRVLESAQPPDVMTPVSPEAGEAKRRIRLAYLCGEFRQQATSVLMVQTWEHHDRERFELIALDNGWDDGSPMRRRIERAFDAVIDISRMSDDAVAQWVVARGVDILVNLNGFFGHHRNGVFALKPAPLQVNYLGFPGTMGADYMDYIIADRVVIPPDSRRFFDEQVVYLPGSYQANDSHREIAHGAVSRLQCGLPESGFVFCCFNNNYKILPRQFDVWMRILRSVEGSVLWLIEDNATAARNLRREAASRGVDPVRIVFASRVSLPEHLARHRLADLFIDTLPYNAHTTASDALWAGLPVLTCVGHSFAGRVAASLLHAIGLPELVTTCESDYEAEAIGLARDPARLGAIRARLAARRANAPLFDAHGHARHLEAAYCTMQARRLAGLSPAPIEADGASARAIHEEALRLEARGSWAQAIVCHDRAIDLEPANPEWYYYRGMALRANADPAAAVASYDRAIALRPDYPEVWFSRGNALQDLGRTIEAFQSHERAVALRPGYVPAWMNRANVLRALGQIEAALLSVERALELAPEYAEAYCNRGNLLADLGRLEEAVQSHDRAIAVRVDYADAWNNRGNVLKDLGRLDAAIGSYDRAIALQPGFVDAIWNKALALLALGDYRAGWPLYEARWKRASFTSPRRAFTQPLWLGQMPVAGKTLLLHAEQGLGDTLQFCRLAPCVAALGARVILEVPVPLTALLACLGDTIEVVAAGTALPPFDAHCPLLSLPLALSANQDLAPAPHPYLRADPARVALWQQRLGPRRGLRVGLCWSGRPAHGNDRNRSLSLSQLLRHLPSDLAYHSLQAVVRDSDQASLRAATSLHDHASHLKSFADTAALVACLDLVISVDTSVAHLAGALGRPVWVLVPQPADWRWMLDRADSPWYPSARLYRQPRRGDWETTLARVAHDLRHLADAEDAEDAGGCTEDANPDSTSPAGPRGVPADSPARDSGSGWREAP